MNALTTSPGRASGTPSGSSIASSTATTAGRGGSSSRPGAVWAVPGLLFFVLFAVVPMGGVVYLSLTSWDGLTAPHLVGGAQWARLLSDPAVVKASAVTLLLLVANIVVQAPIAVAIGVWSAGSQRNRAVLSSVFFLPLVLSTAATAVMWKQVLDPNFGLPSQVPWLFGGGDLFGTGPGALTAIVLVTSWQFVPFHALLYQGAAKAIPEVLYQAAAVDGAGRSRTFFSITLPQLRNTVVTSTTFMLVGGLTAFDLVLVLTNGGPGTDTATLPLTMYQQAFKSYDFGYASAIAVLLLALATVVSLVIVRTSGFDRMQGTTEGL